MNKRIYFDESLPKFAKLVVDVLGEDALSKNFFLRDASGCLTFILLQRNVSAKKKNVLMERAVSDLFPYVDTEGFCIATPDELFDESLRDLNAARLFKVRLDHEEKLLRVVDRRMVGADWLRVPAKTPAGPLRVVFASLKGGVGRSTALCVAAAHLASRGNRILAIDMDLEAPGLGNMLLSSDTLPSFGLLDYVVEQTLAPLDDLLMNDMVGHSWLTGGRGRVDVIPAMGKKSLANPENVLGKLARAYLASSTSQPVLTFTDHISAVVDQFSNSERYDAILIDARAGLHETTAASILGLGAEIFLFGIDQPQTFAGYELLLASLAGAPIDIDDDWRERIRFIQAKASENSDLRRNFSAGIEILQRKYLWGDMLAVDGRNFRELGNTFEVEWDDANELPKDWSVGPPEVSFIVDDANFRNFDPLKENKLLDSATYLAPYRAFLVELQELMGSVEELHERV